MFSILPLSRLIKNPISPSLVESSQQVEDTFAEKKRDEDDTLRNINEHNKSGLFHCYYYQQTRHEIRKKIQVIGRIVNFWRKKKSEKAHRIYRIDKITFYQRRCTGHWDTVNGDNFFFQIFESEIKSAALSSNWTCPITCILYPSVEIQAVCSIVFTS